MDTAATIAKLEEKKKRVEYALKQLKNANKPAKPTPHTRDKKVVKKV